MVKVQTFSTNGLKTSVVSTSVALLLMLTTASAASLTLPLASMTSSEAPPMTSSPLSPMTSRRLGVTSCRAACVRAFSDVATSIETCLTGSPDCFQCWDSCFLFAQDFSVWGVMCATDNICREGCQIACAHQRRVTEIDYVWSTSAPTSSLSVHTNLADASVTVDWSDTADVADADGNPVVYAVLTRRRASSAEHLGEYRFLRETLRRRFVSRHADVVFDTDAFLVVAVGVNGVVRYYRVPNEQTPLPTTVINPASTPSLHVVSSSGQAAYFSTLWVFVCLLLLVLLIAVCVATATFLVLVTVRRCFRQRKQTIRSLVARNYFTQRGDEFDSMPDLRISTDERSPFGGDKAVIVGRLHYDTDESDDPHATFLIRADDSI